MKLKDILYSFRELVWPILEKIEDEDLKLFSYPENNISDEDLDLAFKYVLEYKISEENRRKEIESKATIFIGTFAVAATILINLIKEFIFGDVLSDNLIDECIFLLVSLTVIYLCRAIYFAINTLKRGMYHRIGMPSILFIEEKNKKMLLIKKEYDCIIKNRNIINLKVDYMTMAQLYFQRSVVSVGILTILFLLKYILLVNLGIRNSLQVSLQIIYKNYFGLIIFSLLIILLVLTWYLYKKIKKLEGKETE